MKRFLSDTQIKYYAKRIIHYLKGIQKRKGYSSQDLADKLGVSLSHFRKFETEGYAEAGKYISAVETLIALGSLENLNLHQFSYYLDNPSKQCSENYDEILGVDFQKNSAQNGPIQNDSIQSDPTLSDSIQKIKFDGIPNTRKMYTWEKQLLAAFNKLDMDSRSDFMNRYISDKSDATELVQIVKLSIMFHDLILKNKKETDLRFFEVILEYMFTKSQDKGQARMQLAKESILNYLSNNKEV